MYLTLHLLRWKWKEEEKGGYERRRERERRENEDEESLEFAVVEMQERKHMDFTILISSLIK